LRASGGVAIAVAAGALLAALLLVATEFLTIASVDVASGSCEVISRRELVDRCQLSGFERHGGAFLLLGALALPMAVGAGRGRSRPAATALVAIAVIVLAFALARDLPQTKETGAVGVAFEGARGEAGAGLYMEIVAAVLLATGGALVLARRT
jgi:hypothetical protein